MSKTRRKVEVECLFCGRKFESKLRWEGVPEEEYCTPECKRDDEEYGDTFEKFHRGNKDEW